MLKECIETGKTVDQAIESACAKLGLSIDEVSFDIIDMPRRSMFGLKVIPAKVRVYAQAEEAPVPTPAVRPAAPKPQRPAQEEARRPAQAPAAPRNDAKPKAQTAPGQPKAEPKAFTPEEEALAREKAKAAMAYLRGVMNNIGLNSCTISEQITPDGVVLTLSGEDMGVVIGRRGETLDSLQYLVGLVANRLGGSYLRITIDSGNFREKREKTLQSLARRLALGVVRSGRPVTLEPMNPYERRIIHAVVSSVDGATSTSVGEEPNRRVVINSKFGRKPGPRGSKPGFGGSRKPGGAPRDGKPGGYQDKPPFQRDNKPGGYQDRPGGPRRDNKPYGGGKPGFGRGPRPEQQPARAADAQKHEPRVEAEDKPLYSKIKPGE